MTDPDRVSAADAPRWPLARWGKHWGLRRLADADGFFSMVAIDQRPPIVNLVAKARGIAPQAVGFEDIVAAKALLAEGLAAHASALLVDPNFGLPAATPHLAPARGLVVTLEEHRYDERPDGRRSAAIPNWSVAQIRRLGADAVKLLAWYRPDAGEAVRAHQHAFVRQVGEDCRRHDIPFIFELLVHPFAAGTASGPEYQEDPAKQARLVIDSVRAFADPAYGVDLFKLESPLPMSELPAPDAAGAAAAQALFDEMGAACAGTPWVMLSAGATMASFEHAIAYACRAGASGFLAGRAVWWEALSAFPDGDAVRQRLHSQSLPYLQRLQALARRLGRPWRAGVDFGAVTAEGQFCRERSTGA
jgi:tagatose 1,6-diphosphate aldolase